MNAARSSRHGDLFQALIAQIDQVSQKTLGFQLRATQRTAGHLLLERCIVEMPTGEGKTVTSALPAAVFASAGRRVLVATANDYLAERDAHWMRPIYDAVQVQTSCVTSETDDQTRRSIYESDVIYGTLREFAFDYLRLSLAARRDSGDVHSNAPALRTSQHVPTGQVPFPFDVLIIDEADSILIDEARTPMIITAPTGEIDRAREACYRWAAHQAPKYIQGHHFLRLPDSGVVALTDAGRHQAIGALLLDDMHQLTTTDILHSLERAILVNETIQRDAQYVVEGGAIHIVDEYTGRKASERNFGGGVQQAIEAREGLALTRESEPVARISVQDFVTKFTHLCGMTATGWEDRHEFQSVYGLNVRRLPPFRPSQRRLMPPRVSRTRSEKWDRIAEETERMIAQERAVLIGTRTVEQSEQLSQRLQLRQIEHDVLNARNPAKEATIVAAAGQPCRVTVATNMAGRGTDIELADSVREAGGLHVIVSEPHAAVRIDRQLIGRAARQGDPGSARLFASAEDEILTQAFGESEAERIRIAATTASDRWLMARVRRAQRQVARRHRAERAQLTARDAQLSEAMLQLGLDPHLDPLPETR